MTSRLLIVGTVALGSVVAAGVGGYLAVRTATHTSQAAPAIAAPLAASAAEESPAPVSRPAVAAQPEMNRQVDAPLPREARPSVRQTTPQVYTSAPELATGPAELPSTITSLPAVVDEPDPAPVAASASEPAPAVTPRFDVYELPANAVIGIQLDESISSETARVEDPVRARVTRAVVVDGVTVIPTGTRLNGSVTLVERGGKIRDRARIGIRFSSVTVNGVRIPLHTDAIYREGDAPGGEATAKIGASAVVGSILGGVFGGKKGAAIGGAAGAAGGTAMVVTGDRNAAALVANTALTVRLTEPAEFRIER